MKITKGQLKRIIREAWSLENGVAPEDKGAEGDANALLVLYLRGDLDEQELQYLKEDHLSGEVDINTIVSVYESLIAIISPLTEK